MNDRRVIQLSLTQAGRHKLSDAPERLEAGFVAKFNQLQDWERSQLIASVQCLASMMDAEKIDAAPILEIGEIQPCDK